MKDVALLFVYLELCVGGNDGLYFSLRSLPLAGASFRSLRMSLSCHCRVVFAKGSHLSSSNGARHTIHYDTAHATAHVDDTLGGSPLSERQFCL